MTSATRKARTTLLWLLVLILSIAGLLAYNVYGRDKSWTPGLALDLAGGTQIILEPVSKTGEEITPEVLEQAVAVIRARVDGTGVAEAEITTQGGENIIVSIPGEPDQKTLDLVTEAAQLTFRPVLYVSGPSDITLPTYLDPAADVFAALTDDTASSYALIDDEVRQAWEELDCAAVEDLATGNFSKPGDVLVTCSDDADPAFREKFILGPVEIFGNDIDSATSGPKVNAGGTAGNAFAVYLTFTGSGKGQFGVVTGRLAQLESPRNQFAMVLDGAVISAPFVQEALTSGQAEISRSQPPMQRAETEELATKLKYGALPLDMVKKSSSTIPATKGEDQLKKGLLAGALGLLLVVLYSLLQYRALAIVTIGSLVIAGALTMGVLGLFSSLLGYRLSLAGVTGIIVSIGITVDSFIVYFERVRDELRDGKSLPAAVDHGWSRARRTIIASDTINLLAAAALYVTAVGNVRGFAFTLGLTTVIDLMVVAWFTHPILVLLARTKFFGGGHRFSGLDPRQYGRGAMYKGRGRVEAGAPTLAERKAGIARGEAS